MGVVMFKKIASGFMLSFICLIQISCCSIKNYQSSNDIRASYLNHKFNKGEGKLVNQNFIFMSKYVMTKDHNDYTQVCYKDQHDYLDCNDPLVPVSSASGYIVDVDKKNNTLYAITAAHWCEETTKDELYDTTEIIFDSQPIVGYFAAFMGNEYKIKSYIMDQTTDLCLVVFTSKYAKYAKNINVAKSDPSIGDNVYAISAPMWSYEDEFRQHYEGKSSGCDEYECAFTMPATYGSSGSAVINESGEIISVISRAAVSFNNYAIGAKPGQIKKFLEHAYETLRR